MTIDAHQHFWRYDPARDGWISDDMAVLKRDYLPGDLIPQLDANGIEATVAVQADQSERETLFLLDLAQRQTRIAGVVGWVDLRARDVSERLEYFSRFALLRGFRHVAQSEPDDRFLVRNDFVRGVACLRRFNFTFDLLIYPKQLPAAIELVEGLPDQAFVLDHMAKPAVKTREIGEWASSIRRLAAHPRVFCKLSGLITEADWRSWRAEDFKPYLDVVLEAFGIDRLMFGSDWPVCLLAGTYHEVKELVARYLRDFPDSAQDRIFGGNAVSFYGLNALAYGSRSQR